MKRKEIEERECAVQWDQAQIKINQGNRDIDEKKKNTAKPSYNAVGFPW